MDGSRTALVLGGGGVTGIAWEIGMLAGLRDAGVDLTEAEQVIGTSAGSVVGALVTTGSDVEAAYAHQLEEAGEEVVAKLGPVLFARYAAYLLLPGSSRARRARIGAAAMRARTVDESVRVEVIRERLGKRSWPLDRDLRVTAVDATTGELTVFDKDSEVDLVSAVAASCAVPLVWPPVTINGRTYIDGGVRSPANADLARGAERVVVLAPLTSTVSASSRISNQLARLAPGVQSVVVSPDGDAKRAIGKNVLDPSRRAVSAQAGRAQADAVLDAVKAVWL